MSIPLDYCNGCGGWIKDTNYHIKCQEKILKKSFCFIIENNFHRSLHQGIKNNIIIINNFKGIFLKCKKCNQILLGKKKMVWKKRK